MPRPLKCRKIACFTDAKIFKPVGIPACNLEEIIITLDELEALRLADYQGLYQEEAAELMGISRQTFGNIIANARKKVVEAILESKILRIEGGKVEIDNLRFLCQGCGYEWYSFDIPKVCPKCGNSEIININQERKCFRQKRCFHKKIFF